MKKICHVLVKARITGVQKVALGIMDFGWRHFPDVSQSLICCEEGPLTESVRAQGGHATVVSSLCREINPVKDLITLFKFYRYFKTEKFDIVHTHSSKSGLLGRLAAKLAGTPKIIHHVHGYAFHEFSSAPQRILYQTIERIAHRFCHAVVFVNREEALMSYHHLGLPAEKMICIANGVDLEQFSPRKIITQSFPGSNPIILPPSRKGELTMAMIGRLDEQKNPLQLAEFAWALAKIRPEKNWRILVIGGGILEEKLRQKVNELDLQNRVIFCGWVDDVSTLIPYIDIQLSFSLWEGLPLNLIEAAASGIPVVASNIKGNREVVVDNQTGFLCQPTDPVAFADAANKLLESSELRLNMARAAQQRAHAIYNQEDSYSSVWNLYGMLDPEHIDMEKTSDTRRIA